MTNLDDILAISNRRRAEVEALRAEVKRLRQILGGMADLPTWAEEMGELQSEVERLRAVATEFARRHACNGEDFDAFVATLARHKE